MYQRKQEETNGPTGDIMFLGMYHSLCWQLLNGISFCGVASPSTFTRALGIELCSPGFHSEHFFTPEPFLFELSEPQNSRRAFVMFWLVSWDHFCFFSHSVTVNCSGGQGARVGRRVFSFVLLVKKNWQKVAFP